MKICEALQQDHQPTRRKIEARRKKIFRALHETYCNQVLATQRTLRMLRTSAPLQMARSLASRSASPTLECSGVHGGRQPRRQADPPHVDRGSGGAEAVNPGVLRPPGGRVLGPIGILLRPPFFKPTWRNQ